MGAVRVWAVVVALASGCGDHTELASSASTPKFSPPAPVKQPKIPPPPNPSIVDELLRRAVDAKCHDAESAVDALVASVRSDPTAIDTLIRRLAEPQARTVLVVALGKVGDPVLDRIPELLTDRSPEIRWCGLRILLYLDGDGAPMAKSVSRLLEDEDLLVRRWAAMVLQRWPDPTAEPALLRSLDDPDFEVRWRSLYALAELPTHSPAARRSILRSAADSHPDVRFVAEHVRRHELENGKD